MGDIFEEKARFDLQKGIHRFLAIRNVFHIALGHRSRCPLLRGLNDADLEECKTRIYDVLERLDSVGFMIGVLEREIEDYRAFMVRVYAPGSGVMDYDYGGPVDFAGAQEDVRTGRFALEAAIFFSASLLEYVARAIGFVFKRPNERHLLALRDALRANPLAQGFVSLFAEHEALCQELQEEGFRDRFVNVDSGPDAFSDRRLRDVAAHYKALRVSGLQLTILANGTIDQRAVLEPGAWSHKRREDGVNWGPGGGILPVCQNMVEELTELVRRSVELLSAEEQEGQA